MSDEEGKKKEEEIVRPEEKRELYSALPVEQDRELAGSNIPDRPDDEV
jgi:hypothetical protein